MATIETNTEHLHGVKKDDFIDEGRDVVWCIADQNTLMLRFYISVQTDLGERTFVVVYGWLIHA